MIEGGTGVDSITVSASDLDDALGVTQVGTRLIIQRSNQTPFILSLASVESVSMFAGGGADTVNVG